MEMKLGLLTILRRLAKYEDDFGDAELQFAHALLSNLTGTDIDAETVNALLSELIEDEHLRRQGDRQAVTGAGKGLVDAVAPQRLDEKDREFIEQACVRFSALKSKDKSEYVGSLREELQSRIEHAGAKVQEIPGDHLVANCAVISLATGDDGIFRYTFEDPGLQAIPDHHRKKRVHKAVDEAEKTVSSPIIVEHVGPTEFRVSTREANLSLEVEGEPLDPTHREELNLQDDSDLFEELLQRTTSRRFRSVGWVQRGRGLSFVDYTSPSQQKTSVGRVTDYKGVRFSVDHLNGHRALLWLAPTTRVILTVKDLIDHLAGEGNSREEIEALLGELKLRVLPRGTDLEYVDIEYGVDTSESVIAQEDETYQEYWSETYGISLSSRVQPVVKFELPDTDLHYPAETVFVDRSSLEEHVGSYGDRRPRTLSPSERLREVAAVLDELFEDSRGPRQAEELSLDETIPSWDRLRQLGYCRKVVRVQPPRLEFGNGAKDQDASTVFKSGPYSGAKDGFLSYIFAPSDVRERQIQTVVQELQGTFERAGFGEIEVPVDEFIFRYDPGEQGSLEDVIKSTPERQEGNQFSLIILPDQGPGSYFISKDVIPEERGIPVQGLKRSTAHRVARGHQGILKQLALQIYCKLLAEDEAVWTLDTPADGENETLYAGIGFSMIPKEGKKGKSATALCDARGRDLRWNVFASAFLDRLIDQEWFEHVLELLEEDPHRPSHDRLVVYRTGDTYEVETEALKASFDAVKGIGGEQQFISIKRDHRRIIADEGGYDNPEPGTAIIFDDEEALLAVTDPFQGTASPVRLVQSIGDERMDRVTREYFDLTFLLWTSPHVAARHPLVTEVAQSLAEFVRELRSIDQVEHLPL